MTISFGKISVYLFILNTGIRCGEAIALEWSDIDFENRICRINKNFTLVKSRDKNWNAGKRQKLVSETKTVAGVREIPLNDRAVEMLQQIQSYNRKRGIETPYVISTDSGARISERSLFQSLEYALGAAEIHHIGLHGLRHTFASTLLRKGVDIAVVSKLLGHRNVTTTLTPYIHIIEQKRNAIKAIPSILNMRFRAKFDPNLTQKVDHESDHKSAVKNQSKTVYISLFRFLCRCIRKNPQTLIFFKAYGILTTLTSPGHQKMHLIGIEPTHAAPEATALSTELQMHL